MISAVFKQHNIRLCLVLLIAILLIFTNNACTIKHDPIQSGKIPTLAAPSPEAVEYGKSRFQGLCKDYDLDSESDQYEKLINIFKEIALAAEVDHLPWHIYLFDEPEIADIRAVHGNYIFVWSGIMDVVKSDDEFAGLLAYELSHVLAQHTDPVKFTLTSELLFSAAELATSLGIIVASQGAVAIGGYGWMKWAYVEIANLDPMDRKYSENYERESANIALSTISRTRYSSQALLDFWKRIAADKSSCKKHERFSRSLSPQQRVEILESLMVIQPKEDAKLAKKQKQEK